MTVYQIPFWGLKSENKWSHRERLYGFRVGSKDLTHRIWCDVEERESSIMYLRTLCWCSYGIWFDYVFKLGRWGNGNIKKKTMERRKSTCMKPNGIHSSFFSSHFTSLTCPTCRLAQRYQPSQTWASETTTPADIIINFISLLCCSHIGYHNLWILIQE